MEVFQEEGSLELGKESGKRALPGRGRNVVAKTTEAGDRQTVIG